MAWTQRYHYGRVKGWVQQLVGSVMLDGETFFGTSYTDTHCCTDCTVLDITILQRR